MCVCHSPYGDSNHHRFIHTHTHTHTSRRPPFTVCRWLKITNVKHLFRIQCARKKKSLAQNKQRLNEITNTKTKQNRTKTQSNRCRTELHIYIFLLLQLLFLFSTQKRKKNTKITHVQNLHDSLRNRFRFVSFSSQKKVPSLHLVACLCVFHCLDCDEKERKNHRL